MRFASVVVLALALVACAPTAKLAASGAFAAPSAYSVTLGRNWSDVTPITPQQPRNVRLLSIDGVALNRLHIASAIKPGEGLLAPLGRDSRVPVFRADMTETEIVEFVVDSVAAMGYQRPEPANLRAANFGTAPGVRFELTTQTSEGLAVGGTALLARVGDDLHVLVFLAPNEHYLGAAMPEVEAIFSSVALTR